MNAQLDVSYGESWDPRVRALAGPLSAEEAKRRHGAGEPYAVLLGGAARPRVLIEVEGRKEELAAWCFDEHLRRTLLFEFRTLVPGRMVLIRMAEWQYAGPDRPELDPTSPRCLTTFGDRGALVVRAFDAPEGVFRTLETYERWIDTPRFGKWKSLVAFVLDRPERERHRIVPHTAHERPVVRAGEPPLEWDAGPLQPGPEVVTAFGPPARYALAPDRNGATPEVVVETHPAGLLRLPTGKLVAADPGWLDDDLDAFTASLPRGSHPVTLAIARLVEEPGNVRVAACRVDVREVPVTSWEHALRPGSDPGSLGDGEFFGLGVDAGMLCFFDAAALPGLVAMSEDWDQPRGLWDELVATVLREASAELEDPETGTNLIAFSVGWGDGVYPVWIGRGADGGVACVVADGRVLSGATLLEVRGDRQNASGGPS